MLQQYDKQMIFLKMKATTFPQIEKK